MSTITIVLATACEARRATLLHRALDSVLGQQGVDVHPVVVVNGSRVDESLCASIVAREGVTVLRRPEGNAVAARRAGLRLVDGAYFGFLDDTDELLPGALRLRVEQLDRDGSIDVVVTNGQVGGEGAAPMVAAGMAVDTCPADTVLDRNWFAPCASLFRAARVDAACFETPHVHFAWTDLWFRLVARRRRVAYVDTLTYRKHEDDAAAQWHGAAARLAYPAFLAELLERPLPREMRARLHRRFHRALHDASMACLGRGNLRGAAGYHAWCLMSGGWRYAPTTRKLVRAGWRRMVAGASSAPAPGAAD